MRRNPGKEFEQRLMYILVIVMVIVAVILVVAVIKNGKEYSGIGGKNKDKRETVKLETTDPHEGEVQVYDGLDFIWIKPDERVAPAIFAESDFKGSGNDISYSGTDFDIKRGIDISEWQTMQESGTYIIDWDAVKKSGIDFAIIRCGWRGNTKGDIYIDEYFNYNIKEATARGINCGVYFFSQATNVQEAVEEAKYVLDIIKEYNVTYPVFFDWEKDQGENARTNGIAPSVVNSCALAFCAEIKANGYIPGVYFNRYLGYHYFDLFQVQDYVMWMANPAENPNFYYHPDMWQCSFDAKISGIEGTVDLNLLFVPKSKDAPERPIVNSIFRSKNG